MVTIVHIHIYIHVSRSLFGTLGNVELPSKVTKEPSPPPSSHHSIFSVLPIPTSHDGKTRKENKEKKGRTNEKKEREITNLEIAFFCYLLRWRLEIIHTYSTVHTYLIMSAAKPFSPLFDLYWALYIYRSETGTKKPPLTYTVRTTLVHIGTPGYFIENNLYCLISAKDASNQG